MKKILIALACAIVVPTMAQVLTKPAIIQKGYTGAVTIVFNPNEGNKGMAGATKCYAHTGITLNGATWQKTGTWRSSDTKYQMTKNSDGNWELSMPDGLYAFYGVASTANVTQMSFVFNDGPSGSLEGKTAAGGDIFVDLLDAGLVTLIQSPADKAIYTVGDEVTFECFATEPANLMLTINGESIAPDCVCTEITTTMTMTEAGDYHVVFSASTDEETKSDSIDFVVMKPTTVMARPEGVELGITYDETDYTKATLCTFAAANKVANNPKVLVPATAVFVVGDFNDWKISADYQMYRDSCHFWLPLENLEPQKEYAYQYVVIRSDGVQKSISDGFAHKQLHPDDKYEPKSADPDHYIPYPEQADGGYVSVLQTNAPQYEWSDATLHFIRPDKNNLIIYELWVYDFTDTRDYAGVMKRLGYLENLGVNAIEFMPICEFDGNYNWGYSPNHYFAADKAYGSADMFKELVDSCHAHGMAVIMDMVFNHATGLNPQNKLYPYGDDLKWNPWFNVNAPHGDTYYEDWNHDFPETRKMFTRSLNYWLDEFKVDGFRMDLSHGFCGKVNDDFANISHYYDNAIVPHDAYFILEHWGDSTAQLINKGMLCWTGAGLSNSYSQLAMGYFTDDNISGANQKGYVSYAESHDEERNFYKAATWGNGIIKNDLEVRMERVPLVMAFNVMPRGSHMLWMNEELGYDYSINSTMGSKTINESNRTSIKERPDNQGWFTAGSVRMRAYEKCAKIIQLRTKIAPHLFTDAPVSKLTKLNSGKLRYVVWGDEEDRVIVVGNFSVDETLSYALPETRTYYDYLNGGVVWTGTLNLRPWEIRILTTKPYETPHIQTDYEEFNTGVYNGIEDILLDASRLEQNLAVKVLIDGQVYILREGVLYDLTGRTVQGL